MSCDGWSVGDRCAAATPFTITLESSGTKKSKDQRVQIFEIEPGDEGVVLEIYRYVQDSHMMRILWLKHARDLVLTHEQIHKIGLSS